jgi:hypothetical protein
MQTLLNASDRSGIVERLRRVTPTTPARFGKLTAGTMVCHLADQLRVGLGMIPTVPSRSLAGRTIVKWIVLHTAFQPPPGKVETAPEMLTTRPTTFAADVAEVERLIEELGTTPASAVHPYFGPLDHAGWTRLAWKHLDHHLRQFGC